MRWASALVWQPPSRCAECRWLRHLSEVSETEYLASSNTTPAPGVIAHTAKSPQHCCGLLFDPEVFRPLQRAMPSLIDTTSGSLLRTSKVPPVSSTDSDVDCLQRERSEE